MQCPSSLLMTLSPVSGPQAAHKESEEALQKRLDEVSRELCRSQSSHASLRADAEKAQEQQQQMAGKGLRGPHVSGFVPHVRPYTTWSRCCRARTPEMGQPRGQVRWHEVPDSVPQGVVRRRSHQPGESWAGELGCTRCLQLEPPLHGAPPWSRGSG